MGLDITIHPIGRAELDYWLFDVVADPSLARRRSSEISDELEKRAIVAQLYEQFPEWLGSGDDLDQTFAFGAAILAGFLHPYFYARGQALSLLPPNRVPEISGLFVPLSALSAGRLPRAEDPSGGLITGNYSASGFLEPGRIAEASALLAALATRDGTRGNSLLDESFDEDGLRALRAALRFVADHDLGLIEAADVVTPLAGEGHTDLSNMRAAFLGNLR
jgi:hypothetical protein